MKLSSSSLNSEGTTSAVVVKKRRHWTNSHRGIFFQTLKDRVSVSCAVNWLNLHYPTEFGFLRESTARGWLEKDPKECNADNAAVDLTTSTSNDEDAADTVNVSPVDLTGDAPSDTDLAAFDVDPASNALVEGVAAVATIATAKGTVGTKGTKGNSSKIPKKVCNYILWIVFI